MNEAVRHGSNATASLIPLNTSLAGYTLIAYIKRVFTFIELEPFCFPESAMRVIFRGVENLQGQTTSSLPDLAPLTGTH